MLSVVKGKKMVYDGTTMAIDFQDESPVNPARIMELARKKMKGLKLSHDLKLTVLIPDLAPRDVARNVKELLRLLVD